MKREFGSSVFLAAARKGLAVAACIFMYMCAWCVCVYVLGELFMLEPAQRLAAKI